MFRFPLYRHLSFIAIAACAVLLAAESSAWAMPAVFETVIDKLANTFTGVRAVVYVCGAFSLLGFAIMGFMGKAKWQTVAIMAGGLFTLVIAAEIISYVVGGGGGGTVTTTAEGIFEQLVQKLAEIFSGVRAVVYVMGAFTLVGVAIAAILGKVKWQLVAHMAAGLFILVIAAEIIRYIGKPGVTTVTSSSSGDLFSGVLDKLATLFSGLRNVVYVASAFALVAAAIGGLMGKLQWKTVAHMAAALYLLLITEQVINYVVGQPILQKKGEWVEILFPVGDYPSQLKEGDLGGETTPGCTGDGCSDSPIF
jgi:type IV secretory pathway VirB2 component (pilin)